MTEIRSGCDRSLSFTLPPIRSDSSTRMPAELIFGCFLAGGVHPCATVVLARMAILAFTRRAAGDIADGLASLPPTGVLEIQWRFTRDSPEIY